VCNPGRARSGGRWVILGRKIVKTGHLGLDTPAAKGDNQGMHTLIQKQLVQGWTISRDETEHSKNQSPLREALRKHFEEFAGLTDEAPIYKDTATPSPRNRGDEQDGN